MFGRGKGGSFLSTFQGCVACLCCHPDARLPASRTARDEISVVLCRPVGGTLYSSPRKLPHTVLKNHMCLTWSKSQGQNKPFWKPILTLSHVSFTSRRDGHPQLNRVDFNHFMLPRFLGQKLYPDEFIIEAIRSYRGWNSIVSLFPPNIWPSSKWLYLWLWPCLEIGSLEM